MSAMPSAGAATAPARSGAGADHDVLQLLGVAVLDVPLPACPVGPVDHVWLLCLATHGVVDAVVSRPESERRASAAITSPVVSVSTPRWLIHPDSP